MRRDTAVRERCTLLASSTVVRRVLADSADSIATSYRSSPARCFFITTVSPAEIRNCISCDMQKRLVVPHLMHQIDNVSQCARFATSKPHKRTHRNNQSAVLSIIYT